MINALTPLFRLVPEAIASLEDELLQFSRTQFVSSLLNIHRSHRDALISTCRIINDLEHFTHRFANQGPASRRSWEKRDYWGFLQRTSKTFEAFRRSLSDKTSSIVPLIAPTSLLDFTSEDYGILQALTKVLSNRYLVVAIEVSHSQPAPNLWVGEPLPLYWNQNSFNEVCSYLNENCDLRKECQELLIFSQCATAKHISSHELLVEEDRRAYDLLW